MKKLLLFVLAATALAACSTDTTQDLAPEIPTAPDELQVSFDEEDTRIQLGENGAPVWTEGDLVSVFYRSNAHDKYEFTGETGDTSGTLKRVSQGTPTVGLDKVVAIYPYNENYLLSLLSGNIKASLPAEQTYLADSYGLGSSIMISSSKTDRLYMRNVCGWLKLQFTGADTTIKKIVLRGNNDEQVAGDIYICSDDASCTLASDLTGADGVNSGDLEGTLVGTNSIITSVTLNCGDGVALNSETPTAFYVALPPQTFEKGVTITAMCDDGTMRSKSTENSIIVNRNHIVQMASLAVETLETTDTPDTPITPTQPTPAANEIWYTTTSGDKIIVDCVPSDFGAILISNKYENGQGILTFDDKVTKIPTVFRENDYLKSITIPNSVTEIVNNAFNGCDALTSVTIPNSVTTIGDYAFAYCDALTSVTIPDSVTTIGISAFNSCDALTSVTIPNSVTTIGKDAFAYCKALTSVTIPDSVTTIGEDAFAYCSALTSVTIPDSVTTIGERAFYACSALTSVTIPDSVTTIGYDAFYACSALTSVTIGNSVTKIGGSAFASCSALKAFYGKFASADNRCLIVDGVLNSFAPAGLTEYTIPDSVTKIGGWAFASCDALTSVTIPDSVTEIGYMAFCGCSSLKSVTIPDSVTTIGSGAFTSCTALKEVYCEPTTPPSLGDNVFYNNASGRKIYVYTELVNLYKATSGWNDYADSIYSMGNYPANGETTIILYTTSDGQLINTSTFPIKSNTYQNGIGKMVVVGTLSTIPGEAFAYCSALTSVTIPDSVTTIGSSAFRDCSALTSVTIGNSVTSIGSSAFRDCDALTSVTIGNSVTSIGSYAFHNCSALTSITIPDSVTTIGNYAFRDCDALKSVTIPNSVTTIGDYAFAYCDALTNVTIGDSVTTIGSSAFRDCDALKEVYCKPTTPPSLGNSYVFDNNASDRKIYVPTASVDAYKSKQYWSEYALAIEPYNFAE